LKFLNLNYFNKNLSSDNSLYKSLTYDFNFKNHKYNHFYSYYSFFKNNIKSRKIYRKAINGRRRNQKNDSFKRDKNSTIVEQFFNVSMKDGKKLVILKQWNIFILNLFDSFKENNNNLSHYKNYESLIDLLNSKKNYYNFDTLLNRSLVIFEPLFNVKIEKASKRMKSKLNRKYVYKVVYIKKEKRLKHVLKLINSYSERFQNYNYWERLYWMFASILLESKNSYL
jgi:hypothetical protein